MTMRMTGWGLIGLLAAACGGEQVDQIEVPVEGSDFDRIVVTTRSGGVEVTLGAAIEVAARRLWTGSTPPEVVAREAQGTLRLNRLCSADPEASCNVEFAVVAPPGIDIEVVTAGGSVAISGAGGDVEVNTESGRVEITDVPGNVFARSGSGTITVANASRDGEIDVDAASGAVDLQRLAVSELSVAGGSGTVAAELTVRPSLVDISTTSGGVDLALPTGDYSLALETAGEVTTEGVTDAEDAGSRIEVRSDSGAIAVTGQ